MSRLPTTDQVLKYHPDSIKARNRLALALRQLIKKKEAKMSDVDRTAGWWPGRTSRITLPLRRHKKGTDAAPAARYHLTLEDVFEIGRFLELKPVQVLEALVESLREED
ncbi:MAG TPA: hypothetical protein VMR44_10360 [Thermoanaerobaculia bacterium]|nr:hypothetical protein [Thermoanaerobaculia bacterium]